MNRTHKWPAKALNLLVAVAMVISMVAVLAPVVAADTPDEIDCDPVEQFVGCNMEVFVNTYTKDDVTGDFTADNQFVFCEYFYVNAVVVNTGNETMEGGNVTAEILLPVDVDLVACADNDGNQTKAMDPVTLGGVEMVDFWWKVHCNAAGGLTEIEVSVTSDLECPDPVVGSVFVTQREEDECITIEIIEAPGMQEKVGAPASPFGQTVVPCTNFGIKARITNNCLIPYTNVNGTIRWGLLWNPNIGDTGTFVGGEDTGAGLLAEIVGGDPAEWCVGGLDPGDSAIVGWTLHCEAPGDIQVLVQAEDKACADASADETLHPWTIYIDNPWTVIQQEEAGLLVEILQPGECEEVLTYSANCPEDVEIVVRTTNNSPDTLEDVIASIDSGNGTDVWTWVGSKYDIVGILNPGQSALSYFAGRCMGVGMVELEANAEGKVVITEESVIANTDTVQFLQNAVKATMPATAVGPGYSYTLPSTVNVCDVFDVVGSFWNNSGVNLTDATVCIYWKGNATLLGMQAEAEDDAFEPQYDRCLAQGPGWEFFTSPNTTVNGPDGEGYYWNCQTVAICDCCETRVKWTFMCRDEEDIEFYTSMSAVVGSDTFEDNSLSPDPLVPAYPDCALYPVVVEQEWKAHLIVGLFTFLQNDCGAMLERDAFAPCQNFHVVIPVVNVGQEAAENVVVNFVVTGNDTWDVDEIATPVTGDIDSYAFDPETGIGWGKFNSISGNSTEKLILQLHCQGEGRVNILIPPSTGVVGEHANTGAAIDINNREWPDCPIGVDQIPFTVELVNPIDCETFNPGDRFTVKVRLHNDGDTALDDVSATIHWTGTAAVEPPQTQSGPVGGVYSSTKTIGNSTDDTLGAHSYAELTWVMNCTGAGEVYFSVTATSQDPYLTTESQETVNIHQAYAPDIEVTMLSPENYDTPIATGQEYAVTAVVRSVGGLTATGVTAALYDRCNLSPATGDGSTLTFSLDEGCITPGTETIYVAGVAQVRNVDYTIDYIGMMTGVATITFAVAPANTAVINATFLPMHTIIAAEIDGVDVDPATQVLNLGAMAPNTFKIVTWTLHADTNCRATCTDEVGVELGVGVNATNLVPGLYGDYDYSDVEVDLYTAAHLVVEIGEITPSTTFGVCDEFVVPYTVYNTGKADAWEVTATLSVEPEGSVRIAEGDWGFTQYIGTLVGWGTGDYYEGEFTLHCKEACTSTITITPAGRDECGHYALIILGEIDLPIEGGEYGFWDETWEDDFDENWHPGVRIPDFFIEPDSVTVKQLESGGIDLGITKTVDDAYPEIEQTVEFTIMVINYGPTDATGVVVEDLLSTDLTFEMAEMGDYGTYNDSTGVWTVGSLSAGAVATLQIWATVDATDEIVNTAAITAVDQPDGYPLNDEAFVVLNQEAVTSVEIDLDEGWNLISLPLIPTNNDLETMLAPVWSDFVRAFKYDACTETWTSYIKDGPTPSLTDLDDGYGYWILMDGDGTITVSGVVALDPPNLPPSYDVCEGWDLIGFKSITAISAGEYLAALQAAGVPTWTRVWGFANGGYHIVLSDGMMEPGFGYWLAVLADGTIYP